MKCSLPENGLCTNSLRILNFDGSVTAQANLLRKYKNPPYSVDIIDFTDIASRCRYLSTSETLNIIKERISNSSPNAITLYGSGDFHHISSLLIANFKNPIAVIVFDYHPDWDGFSPLVSCGSWVARVSKFNNVEKMLLLGPSSDDLSTAGLSTAYLRCVKNGKLEIFPYDKKPSRVFLRYLKDAPCFRAKRDVFGSVLHWKLLKGSGRDFIKELLERIPVKDVYVSIDKDCLEKGYAVTNWEEGVMPLDWLLEAISVIKRKI